MNCNNDKNNNSCCISEILSVINILQKNADCNDSCLETCDRGFLGCGTSTLNCNTRPVVLYTAFGNGTPWTMPTTRENVICGDEGVTCSNVFRVEKIDGCCATFRVLTDNTEAMSEAIKKISDIDIAGLNDSIKKLNDAVDALNRLFGGNRGR